MLTRLKKKAQSTLATQAKLANAAGFTPNTISAAGFLLALASGAAYYMWRQNSILPFAAPILLLLSGYCDMLDGALARLHQKTTVFGGFLDSVFDRYADIFVFSGVTLGGLCDPLAGLAATTGALLVSYTRARAEMENVKMESIGLAERAERILIVAAASLTAIIWQPALNIGIIILAILTHLTVAQRTIYFHEKTGKNKT